MPDMSPISPGRYDLGESPVWDNDNDCLYWASIDAGEIHRLNMVDGDHQVWRFDEAVASFGLCRSGQLIVALVSTVVLFDPWTGHRREFARVAHAIAQMRLNDGKVGPDGAFWVGSADLRAERDIVAKLYRIAPSGSVDVKIEGIKLSNGLAWSADGRTMFHTDSRGPWIDRWDFEPETGAISNRRRIVELTEAEGRPDGGACDAAGNYWSAGVSAGRLNCFSPDGRLLQSYALPVQWPTMPCFGGRDMRTLYVTSHRLGGIPTEMDGAILKMPFSVAGVAVHRFAD
jgi:sugar lactone lactonase YvrE